MYALRSLDSQSASPFASLRQGALFIVQRNCAARDYHISQ